MTGNPEQLGLVDIGPLIEVMKSTAAATLAMSEAAQLGMTSTSNAPEQPGNVAAENKRLTLQVLKITAEAMWRVAETARISAAIIERAQIAKMEGDKQSGGSDRHPAAPIKPEEPLVKIPLLGAGRGSVPGDGPFVINERVGTITVAAWEGLSEERLKEIDDGLKDIVKRVFGHITEWDGVGSAIQERLAAIGIQFATSTYFTEGYSNTHRSRVRNTELSYLTRVLAMEDNCRISAGLGKSWYVDEMIRVLQRLMELRGFKI